MKKTILTLLLFSCSLYAMEKSNPSRLIFDNLKKIDSNAFNMFLEQESQEIKDQLRSVWTNSDLQCFRALKKIALKQNNSITFHGRVDAIISPYYVTTIFKNGKQITFEIPDFKKIMFPKQ